jgi:hypothetical protein
MKRLVSVFALFCLAAATASTQDGYPSNYVAATLVRLNDNGGWSWFMDPRVIVNEGKLIIGSVRAVGSNQANVTDPRSGNVEVSVYDIETGKTDTVVQGRLQSVPEICLRRERHDSLHCDGRSPAQLRQQPLPRLCEERRDVQN